MAETPLVRKKKVPFRGKGSAVEETRELFRATHRREELDRDESVLFDCRRKVVSVEFQHLAGLRCSCLAAEEAP